MVAERVNRPLDTLQRFWPDKEAILYDAPLFDESAGRYSATPASDETLLLNKATGTLQRAFGMCQYNCYPVACSLPLCGRFISPDSTHPIHQPANQQKRAAHDFTHELLDHAGN